MVFTYCIFTCSIANCVTVLLLFYVSVFHLFSEGICNLDFEECNHGHKGLNPIFLIVFQTAIHVSNCRLSYHGVFLESNPSEWIGSAV
jgi:hypothetical protein